MITLTETRERFLRAIAQEIPPSTIAEVHFFAALRQSGIESGVAVVAATTATAAPPAESESTDGETAEEAGPGHARYAVYTARYRLVLKGPDRGKWETNVVAEADAPLVTVEAVVRGVQRRSGDMEEPERHSGDDIRELLAAKAA